MVECSLIVPLNGYLYCIPFMFFLALFHGVVKIDDRITLQYCLHLSWLRLMEMSDVNVPPDIDLITRPVPVITPNLTSAPRHTL
jgi:hypothetical protein